MRTALALLSGLLLALSFPKFGHPALAWVSLAPLLVAVTLAAHNGSSRWHSFRLGYLTGLGYFCGTLYWLSLVMAEYGNLSCCASWPAFSRLGSQRGSRCSSVCSRG